MSDTRRKRKGTKGADRYRKVRKAQRDAEGLSLRDSYATAQSYGVNVYGKTSGEARRLARRAIVRAARRVVGGVDPLEAYGAGSYIPGSIVVGGGK